MLAVFASIDSPCPHEEAPCNGSGHPPNASSTGFIGSVSSVLSRFIMGWVQYFSRNSPSVPCAFTAGAAEARGFGPLGRRGSARRGVRAIGATWLADSEGMGGAGVKGVATGVAEARLG